MSDNINQDGAWAPVFDQSFNFAQTSFNTISTVPDTAVIADSSGPISQNPDSNFDWMFPPLLPSHDTSDSLQGFGSNVFSHDGTLGFNPSKTSLCLDFISDDVLHSSPKVDKAAKQKKLEEMKEATRRLEAEIAASYDFSPLE